MRIAVILARTQVEKNKLLFEACKEYACCDEVINFGCFSEEDFSYIDVSVLIGLLLGAGAVDFVVTGCSSGQGMMLACNSMPGVICGYAPTPVDAYLFAQINNGNAISLPLGENYTYKGEENCIQTIEKLFSEPFGQGYPKEAAERKIKDTIILKDIRKKSQIDITDLLEAIDPSIVRKIIKKNDVIEYIINNGSNQKLVRRIMDKKRNLSHERPQVIDPSGSL